MRVPFAELVGGRATPGRPSPYRAMTWRELLDADYRLIQEGVRIAREKTRRIKAGVYDPTPLRIAGKDEED